LTRFAVDTNVLAYAEGLLSAPDDRLKIDVARRLLRGLIGAAAAPVIPVQVLAELHRLLLRKGRLGAGEVSARVTRLGAAGEVIATTRAVFDMALILAEDHGLQTFDAIILAAAAEARCDLLLSEDLQAGFSWRGVVVSNPFGAAPDRRVADLLAQNSAG
jgi:predicted nucleic acid-binding protein